MYTCVYVCLCMCDRRKLYVFSGDVVSSRLRFHWWRQWKRVYDERTFSVLGAVTIGKCAWHQISHHTRVYLYIHIYECMWSIEMKWMAMSTWIYYCRQLELHISIKIVVSKVICNMLFLLIMRKKNEIKVW